MSLSAPIRTFSNVGFHAARRSFAGFPDASLRRKSLAPREAIPSDLKQEDLLSIEGLATGERLSLLVFDERGAISPGLLGLTAGSTLSAGDFDSAALLGWIASQGGDPAMALSAV